MCGREKVGPKKNMFFMFFWVDHGRSRAGKIAKHINSKQLYGAEKIGNFESNFLPGGLWNPRVVE